MSIDREEWRCLAGAMVLLAALTLQTPATAGDGVQVLDHGDGRFTLSTSLVGTDDPEQGGIAISPKAAELCGDLFPHFGRYRFKARAPMEGQSEDPASLEFSQEVSCRDAPQLQAETASAPVPPAPEGNPTDADVELIRALTLTYLQANRAADAEAAYALFSGEMASYATPDAWAAARRAFNAQVGPDARATVVRITWYDNPAGAPVPGRYAAADYDVAYPSNGFNCGYVMWLRQADGGYLIVREEQAQVTPESVANMSAEQVASMRVQVQCRD